MNAKALFTSEEYREQTQFWKEQLGKVAGDFSLRQNWQEDAAEEAACVCVPGEDVCRRLEELARGQDLGLFVLVLAALDYVLYQYTGNPVVQVDVPPLAGGETRRVPLIVEVDPQAPLRAFLGQVRQVVADSYSHQDFPIDQVETALLDRAAAARSNVALYFPAIHQAAAPVADWVVEIERGDRLEIRLCGRRGAYGQAFAECFGRHLEQALAGLGEVERSLGAVDLVGAAERRRLLQAGAGPEADFPSARTIVDLFAEQAARAPEAVALRLPHRNMSYAEVDAQSNQLAHFLLRQYQVERGDVIGVLADRSELLVLGLLGVLKAGAVYLPIDPEFPRERIEFMVADAGCKALLLHSNYLGAMTDLYETPMFALDFQLAGLETPQAAPQVGLEAGDAAYIIYTSGSTGQPKGVLLEHRSFVNMIVHHIGAFGIGPDDRLSQFYSHAFDSSLFEIFAALLSGASLVLVERQTIESSAEFARYVEAQGVTTLTLPPVYLGGLDPARLSGVRRVVSAGDSARVEDAVRLAGQLDYYNSYGPTETSVCATHHRVDPARAYGGRIPIGRPIGNSSIYLLDEGLRLVPEGCVGEICVAGEGVARGYVGRDALTAEKFVEDPFHPGWRIYRTGDLGVWRPDGEVEFLGRQDAQVKVRGYRIELGEIEAVLGRCPGVEQVAVLAPDERPGERRLVAYVTGAAAEESLRAYLGERLPTFMVPTFFVRLEAMPLTANGKIDRRALPAPEQASRAVEYAEPETPMQEALAALWARVLGCERVGIEDNFFELGGDSILAIQLEAEAGGTGLKVTPRMLFEHQTIAELATVAGQAGGVEVDQGPVSGTAPLAPMQRWFFSQEWEEVHHFNQSVMLEVPADFSVEAAREALARLLEHHDALRLRFRIRDGAWAQEYAPPGQTVPLVVEELGGTDDEQARRRAEDLQRSLDLEGGTLLRVGLFRRGPESPALLLFVVHHLVVDGVSWRVLLEDFHAAYEQVRRGESVQLPPKTSAFGTWTARLEELAGENLESEAHWLALAEQPAAPLPVDEEEGCRANWVGEAEQVEMELDEALTQALLHEAPKAYNTQIDDLLLTALALACRQWTGRQALLLDREGHGRDELFAEVDLSRTVGWFTALYPVWLDLEGAAGVEEALKTVKEQLRSAPGSGIEFGLLRQVRGDERLRPGPRPELLFNYLGQTDRVLTAGQQWRPVLGLNGAELSPRGRRSHLLELNCLVLGGRLRQQWTFGRRAHRPATVERLAAGYRDFLIEVIEHCIAVEVPGYTPSDFPGARMDSGELETLLQRLQD